MAISTKFFLRRAGNGLMQAPFPNSAPMRFDLAASARLTTPPCSGDPDHYSKRLITTADNGGVHTNCTIIDHAFYLAIESGTNRTSGLSVRGSRRFATRSKCSIGGLHADVDVECDLFNGSRSNDSGGA